MTSSSWSRLISGVSGMPPSFYPKLRRHVRWLRRGSGDPHAEGGYGEVLVIATARDPVCVPGVVIRRWVALTRGGSRQRAARDRSAAAQEPLVVLAGHAGVQLGAPRRAEA